VKRMTNAQRTRTAVLAAALVILCVFAGWAQRNHGGPSGGGQRSAPAPHSAQPRSEGRTFSPQTRQAPRQQNVPQYRPTPQPQGGQPPHGNFPEGGQQNNFAPPSRPGFDGAQQPYRGAEPQTYGTRPPMGGNQQYGNGGRQQYSGAQPNNYGGRQPYNGLHLQDWLSRNQNVPVQDQERQLHNDPSFKRLPQADQQRLTQQLRSVDRMPEPQRDRRLARNEMLERLSPDQRMNINRSGREWSALPSDRQMQMRRAFQDLRGVPLDQRQTVLNSSHYQNMFTPQERGILSDFLKVEPYEPQR
jgi:hypothetical protein